jgi:hypothetical protein
MAVNARRCGALTFATGRRPRLRRSGAAVGFFLFTFGRTIYAGRTCGPLKVKSSTTKAAVDAATSHATCLTKGPANGRSRTAGASPASFGRGSAEVSGRKTIAVTAVAAETSRSARTSRIGSSAAAARRRLPCAIVNTSPRTFQNNGMTTAPRSELTTHSANTLGVVLGSKKRPRRAAAAASRPARSALRVPMRRANRATPGARDCRRSRPRKPRPGTPPAGVD